MPRVGLEEVTSPASAQSVAMSLVFPQNSSTPECSLDDWGGATHLGGATRVAPPTPNSIGL